MSGAKLKAMVAALGAKPGTAIALAFAYPVVFALSNNWYTTSAGKIAWLIGAIAVAAVAAWALYRGVGALADRLFRGPRAAASIDWAKWIKSGALAAISVGALIVLLAGTLHLGSGNHPMLAVGIWWLLGSAAVAGLIAAGHLARVNLVLALLVGFASASWVLSAAQASLAAALGGSVLEERASFEGAKFKAKPNIYFFIYDAYGSEDVYKKNLAFDNSPHYRDLAARGFKVVHTFSNYFATWPTTMSVFLGQHHYYDLSSGVDDTKFGRAMMAGLARNPVLETLRANGYRIQYVHGIDYFVHERGTLDFLYPEDPPWSVLRIFGSPVLHSLIGKDNIVPGRRERAEQKEVLFARIDEAAAKSAGPWFTFVHVNLPAHGPIDKSWFNLAYFEKEFREKTVAANAHMLEVMGRIIGADPGAVVIVIGDHGAWRYRNVWVGHDLPSEALKAAGIAPETVALDLFGIMIAVRAPGGCDRSFYAGITPVNVMRALFACLSENADVMRDHPADISLFKKKDPIWAVAKDGRALPAWELFERN